MFWGVLSRDFDALKTTAKWFGGIVVSVGVIVTIWLALELQTIAWSWHVQRLDKAYTSLAVKFNYEK